MARQTCVLGLAGRNVPQLLSSHTRAQSDKYFYY